eukprot:TRINITY_DN1892_c0_g1_i1.p1 TRINITY_DN1892_c0_g1~~TRINITY_DN1892_c0_g1_i1.p1  ORF type:complete len:570 (-),score=125.52 TRINITY_DN1892_c0_g1_i1:78-1787(-)
MDALAREYCEFVRFCQEAIGRIDSAGMLNLKTDIGRDFDLIELEAVSQLRLHSTNNRARFAVCGAYNSGKTTLINKLFNVSLCTGNLASTCVPHIVGFRKMSEVGGHSPMATLRINGGEISFEKLAQSQDDLVRYISTQMQLRKKLFEPGQEGMLVLPGLDPNQLSRALSLTQMHFDEGCKHLGQICHSVDVDCHMDYCAMSVVELVDCPGWFEQEERSSAADNLLKNSIAALYVIGATEAQRQDVIPTLLEKVKVLKGLDLSRRVVVIVTKCDMMSVEEMQILKVSYDALAVDRVFYTRLESDDEETIKLREYLQGEGTKEFVQSNLTLLQQLYAKCEKQVSEYITEKASKICRERKSSLLQNKEELRETVRTQWRGFREHCSNNQWLIPHQDHMEKFLDGDSVLRVANDFLKMTRRLLKLWMIEFNESLRERFRTGDGLVAKKMTDLEDHCQHDWQIHLKRRHNIEVDFEQFEPRIVNPEDIPGDGHWKFLAMVGHTSLKVNWIRKEFQAKQAEMESQVRHTWRNTLDTGLQWYLSTVDQIITTECRRFEHLSHHEHKVLTNHLFPH